MKWFYVLVCSQVFASHLWAQLKPQDQGQTAHSFHQTVEKTLECPYLLFLPRDYQARPTERWPLLFFLHGAGERGSNVWRADLHGPAKYIARHPEFPFIMVSPLCPSNQVWSTELLLALLNQVQGQYRADTNRIYLTGLSMGGFGAWDLAMAAPEKFAAVLPIAGGGNDLEVVLARIGYSYPSHVQAFKSLAFWAVHGGQDTVVPPEESKRMIASLQQLGVAEARLTIYPEAKHNAWQQVYDEPETYAWLLRHTRHLTAP